MILFMKSKIKKILKIFVLEPMAIFIMLLGVYSLPVVSLPVLALGFLWWLYLPRLQYREGYKFMMEYYVEEQDEDEKALLESILLEILPKIHIKGAINIHKASSLDGVAPSQHKGKTYTLFVTNKLLAKGGGELKTWVAERLLLVRPTWRREDYDWLKQVRFGFIIFLPALFLPGAKSIALIALMGVIISRVIWFIMWSLYRGERKSVRELLAQIN